MNNELPDDIELLKAMLRKQQSRLRQYACQVAGYEQEIERLKAQLDRLRRMLFGQSSEKSVISLKIRSDRQKTTVGTGKPAEHSQKSSGRCIVSHRFT
ncbi:transposase [Shigella flexneri]|uniref:transposase n=1 Tax=Shigella flexneri TaxID=623 RepID=UPI0020966869|nr:transposase [Shigella flexneri]